MTWTSTADTAAIAARLKQAQHVLVLTHAKPDGDAAGSALALTRALVHAGKQATLCFTGPIPAWLDELAGATPRRIFAPMKPAEPADGRPWQRPEADLTAIVDTGSWEQLAEMKPLLEGRAGSTVIIDHHAHGNEEIADARLIDTTAASATQVLAPVLVALLNLRTAAALPLDVATPLYLGLATDTGWFRYNSVNPQTFRLAADLREAGVNHTDLYRLIEQQDTLPRWRLLGRALASVQTHDLGRPWGKLAVMSLTLRDFTETGAEAGDTGGFADMLLAVADIGAAALLTEAEVASGEPPLTKISIRSKPAPAGREKEVHAALDAGTLTARLGGGGHFHAAGAKVRADLATATRALLEAARAL